MNPNLHNSKNLEVKKNHRKDIDGLRGLAVISVILLHAFPTLFSGGFIGVDIFFVISGFLISGILYSGLESNTFSVVGFYVNRVMRIFPSLVLIMLITTLTSWVIFLPIEFKLFGSEIIAGSFFFSNLLQMKGFDYFDGFYEPRLFLHLWSLAIEEQFYLVFPLFLLLVYKIIKSQVLNALLLFICISFSYGVWMTSFEHNVAFYSFTSRAWELLFGAVISYLVLIKQIKLNLSTRAIVYFECLLISLALLAIILIDFRNHFPGVWALVPIAISGGLLLIGSDGIEYKSILKNEFLRFFGIISYPLYLWHWILLVFVGILYGHKIGMHTFMAVGSSVILAWFTHKYWETPFRYRKSSIAAIVFCLCLFMFGVIGWMIAYGRIKPLNANDELERIIAISSSAETEFAPQSDLEPGLLKPAILKGQGEFPVLFIGDSLASQYFGLVKNLSEGNDKNFSGAEFLTKGGCPPIPELVMNYAKECDIFIEKSMQYSFSKKFSAVVFSAAWADPFFQTENDFQSGRVWAYSKDDPTHSPIIINSEIFNRKFKILGSWFKLLRQQGIPVYVILSNPMSLWELSPKATIQRVLFIPSRFGVNKAEILKSHNAVRQKLFFESEAAGATVIDPFYYLCNDDFCPSMTRNGVYIYSDGIHISNNYMTNHITYLDSILMQNSN